MNVAEAIALWVGGLMFGAVLCYVLLHRFSPGLRVRRKRQRNYGKVIAKVRRPVVMLKVDTVDTDKS